MTLIHDFGKDISPSATSQLLSSEMIDLASFVLKLVRVFCGKYSIELLLGRVMYCDMIKCEVIKILYCMQVK